MTLNENKTLFSTWCFLSLRLFPALKSFPLKSSLLLMMFPDVYCIFYRVAFLTLKCLFVLSGQKKSKQTTRKNNYSLGWKSDELVVVLKLRMNISWNEKNDWYTSINLLPYQNCKGLMDKLLLKTGSSFEFI